MPCYTITIYTINQPKFHIHIHTHIHKHIHIQKHPPPKKILNPSAYILIITYKYSIHIKKRYDFPKETKKKLITSPKLPSHRIASHSIPSHPKYSPLPSTFLITPTLLLKTYSENNHSIKLSQHPIKLALDQYLLSLKLHERQ
ncbi:hypothetical protein EYC80_009634 [Monilinia laxa]|uniref:Uncharacterized protein n=1 Tax=Monilinia laxa TaxID=61186 RepID=A0A5N6JYF6_MONLA|nr:hypothetical protein EYC80_009634 [Monilinia laxa]